MITVRRKIMSLKTAPRFNKIIRQKLAILLITSKLVTVSLEVLQLIFCITYLFQFQES